MAHAMMMLAVLFGREPLKGSVPFCRNRSRHIEPPMPVQTQGCTGVVVFRSVLYVSFYLPKLALSGASQCEC